MSSLKTRNYQWVGATALCCSLLVCAAFFTINYAFAQGEEALPEATEGDMENIEEAREEVGTNATPRAEAVYTVDRLTGDRVFGDFVVGPGKTELQIEPGESVTHELTVANRIGKPHRFFIEIEDASGSNDPNTPIVLLGADRGPYTLKDYISVPAETFILEHNSRARVPVTISVPPDAEPGGRYGSVIVRTVAVSSDEVETDSTAAPATAIVSRIGTLFFVTIPGDTEVGGELKDFTTIPDKAWHQSAPVTFGMLYENEGDLHLNPYGEIRIQNFLGDEIGFIEIGAWYVMPQSLRLREVEWERDFLFGRYTAVANINRGYDNVIDSEEIVFWVLPWKFILAGFGVLFLVFFLFRMFFKKFEFKRKA